MNFKRFLKKFFTSLALLARSETSHHFFLKFIAVSLGEPILCSEPSRGSAARAFGAANGHLHIFIFRKLRFSTK